MENSTPTEFRENDIFRWSFSPEWYEKAKQWRHDPYWCCSRFAIVKGSHLLDTYWLHDLAEQNWTTNGMKWDTRHQLIVELELIANLDDLEKVPEYCADYYDDSDIVDLNHSNNGSGCFYIRKGAQLRIAEDREMRGQPEDHSCGTCEWFRAVQDIPGWPSFGNCLHPVPASFDLRRTFQMFPENVPDNGSTCPCWRKREQSK